MQNMYINIHIYYTYLRIGHIYIYINILIEGLYESSVVLDLDELRGWGAFEQQEG